MSETQTPLLNRAQRRSLKRYIARKARAQMAIVKRRFPGLAAVEEPRCSQCGQRYLGSSGDRCQCKATKRLA